MHVPEQFDKAMYTIYCRARDEAGYNATIFLHMLNECGSLATARTLINAKTPPGGFTQLHLRGRLDLTVEAMVVENEKWHGLFTEVELAKARKRLKDYRYNGK